MVNRNKSFTPLRIALAGLPMLLSACCAAQLADRQVTSQLSASSQGAQVERLDRGLVVIPTDNGNHLSWRLLADDPDTVSFDVYRNGQKINSAKLTEATFFTDEQGEATDRYQVKAFYSRQHGRFQPEVRGAAVSEEVLPWQNPYLSIPLVKPEDDWIRGQGYSYSANDASVADLDGDGEYEILIKWYPDNAKDNSQAGFTGPTLIDAYTQQGEQLWRINLGPNIRSGAHYTQFIAYDFDGDGRAELAMKTADGSVDGEGQVIGNAGADHRNDAGYVLSGPEFLTMFDGLTGKALDTINYEPPRGDVSSWGDGYGNRVDRFLAGVAYLDGEKPSLFMARGYYTRVVVAAYDWSEGKLQSRWVFDTNNGGADTQAYGQGAHSITVGDVDDDGRDEIVYGAATIDDDGHLLYSTGLGHGDAQHMTDIDPNRPGMEIYMVHETPSAYTKNGVEYGVELHDAATGDILWYRPSNQADVGRGVSADIDPNYPGNENWATRGGLVAADGTVISSNRPAPVNFATWWDGDLSRELLDKTTISKWLPEVMGTTTLLEGADYGVVSNNGTKATPALSADIFGDWREEVMWATADSSELRIFSTTHTTQHRFPTLMQETQYRVAIAWQNVGYNQPPHPAFYLGNDMQDAPDYQVSAAELAPFYAASANGFEQHITVNVYQHGDKVRHTRLYRSTSDDPDNKQLIATLSKGESRYTDTDVQPDVTYLYWAELDLVRQFNTVSLPPTYASLSSSLLPVVKVFPVSSDAPVSLSWFTREIDIAGIEIIRAALTDPSADPASFPRLTVATLSPSDTTWTDTTSVGGERYYYWLAFITTSGERVEEGPVFAERFLVPKTHLISEEVQGGIQISWSLEDFSQPIQGVQVYRNTSEQLSGRTRISSSAPVAGSMIDSQSLEPGTTYWYMFKLTMQDGSTVNTDPEAAITYSQISAQPQTNLTSQKAEGGIQLNWSLAGFAQPIRSVQIYRNTSAQLSGRTRINPGAAETGSFLDTQNLVEGTQYWYMFKLTMQDGSTINTDPEAVVTY
ncbi:rhamnogalacturonan lyase [Aestuariibacter sp. GS-14]|uniref:rhamnogalacturonan lyase n=1 Tax=Aestuariibacter sp. GS-14 TaxID=2590670 RepID=UPI0021046353|nr:rhamnogalacturonan lyase [Aestuariibacter sp. GS-14]